MRLYVYVRPDDAIRTGGGRHGWQPIEVTPAWLAERTEAEREALARMVYLVADRCTDECPSSPAECFVPRRLHYRHFWTFRAATLEELLLAVQDGAQEAADLTPAGLARWAAALAGQVGDHDAEQAARGHEWAPHREPIDWPAHLRTPSGYAIGSLCEALLARPEVAARVEAARARHEAERAAREVEEARRRAERAEREAREEREEAEREAAEEATRVAARAALTAWAARVDHLARAAAEGYDVAGAVDDHLVEALRLALAAAVPGHPALADVEVVGAEDAEVEEREAPSPAALDLRAAVLAAARAVELPAAALRVAEVSRVSRIREEGGDWRTGVAVRLESPLWSDRLVVAWAEPAAEEVES